MASGLVEKVNRDGDTKKSVFVPTGPYHAHSVDILLGFISVVMYWYHQEYDQVSFSLVFKTPSFCDVQAG